MASKVGIAAGLGLAGVGLLLWLRKVEAAPPAHYVCSYCGLVFLTIEELAKHITENHPGGRIPITIIWT